LLSSAAGVSQNMPITYKGFTIGHVKKIGLTENDRVKVIFTIFEEYTERVKRGSFVEVISSPLPVLGSGFIFHFSKGGEPINIIDGEDFPYIPEMNSPEVRIYIASGLADKPESGFDINNIINQVTGVLESINASLSGSEGYENLPLGTILNDITKITSSLVPILEDLEVIADEAVNPKGTVMSILDGEGTLYSSIEGTLVSLSGIAENLNKTSEFIPTQLPQVGVIIGEVNTAIRSIQDVLTAIMNNPLLKDGVPNHLQTGPGGASPRSLDF